MWWWPKCPDRKFHSIHVNQSIHEVRPIFLIKIFWVGFLSCKISTLNEGFKTYEQLENFWIEESFKFCFYFLIKTLMLMTQDPGSFKLTTSFMIASRVSYAKYSNIKKWVIIMGRFQQNQMCCQALQVRHT